MSSLWRAAAAALLLTAPAAFGDDVEMLNGSRVSGKILKETPESILVRVGEELPLEMTFARDRVHAITVDSVRRVITSKAEDAPDPTPAAPVPRAATPTASRPVSAPPATAARAVPPTTARPIPATPSPAAGDPVGSIKDLVKSGDMKKAQAAVDAAAGGNYQAMGDRLRDAGVPEMAQYCYLQAMVRDGFPNKRPAARTARQSLVRLFSGAYAPDLAKVADGDYRSACPGYLGLVGVTVTVKDRRIANVSVQSKDDRPKTALQDIPKAIVAQQSIKGVNAVTGATITSHAILCATAAALKSGEKASNAAPTAP